MKKIPQYLLDEVIKLFENLPYKERGIYISEELIKITLELLNDSPNKTLPQNCKNAVAASTLDGLDKQIKIKLPTTQRTANIISDILEEKNIVKVIRINNNSTNRKIKATELNLKWTW